MCRVWHLSVQVRGRSLDPKCQAGVLEKSGAMSRNKQGESREPGRLESGIKEARVGKQERESGNIDQSRETWTIGARQTYVCTVVTLPRSRFLLGLGNP